MTTAHTTLTPQHAESFARIALAHVEREYPNKLDHVINGAHDLRSPAALHPIFYGSFDWHSSVHGYWLLATVLRRFPSVSHAGAIRSLFDRQLTVDKAAAEVAYLAEPNRGVFERTYGWVWLLMLGAELSRHDDADGRRWANTLAPLVQAFASRLRAFLPKCTYPIRAGTHANSAFAIALASEYARTARDGSLSALLKERALTWFADDIDCQAWEPSGDDFLSPALMEAEAMRRVLDPADFARWLDRFLPRLAQRDPGALFVPAVVSDRSDGKIAHLDGLNLSRGWCWRSIGATFAPGDPRRVIAQEAADGHVAAGLPHVTGDYMGEHWMATFATLALLA